MSKLDIVQRDGMVELPSGEVIRSDLSHDEFRSSAINARKMHSAGGVNDYQFGAGKYLEKNWRARLSFFNQLLLHMELRVNLYPKDWNRDEKNLDIELETKAFHEQLLTEMLGPPELGDDIEKFRAYELTGHYLPLAQYSTWRFPWGSVISAHSFSEGYASIRVTYATRTQRSMTNKFVRRRKQ